MEPEDIQSEIIAFYKKLLGSCAEPLPRIELNIIRKGKTLNSEARAFLCQPVMQKLKRLCFLLIVARLQV